MRENMRTMIMLSISMFVLQLLSMVFPVNYMLGVHPRELTDIWAIATMHIVHGSWAHYIGNMFPFFIFGAWLSFINKELFVKTLIFSAFAGGFLVWLFSSGGVVFGASLWVYALAGAILSYFFGARQYIKAVIVVCLLGMYWAIPLVMGLLDFFGNTSIVGHASGLVTGLYIGYKTGRGF